MNERSFLYRLVYLAAVALLIAACGPLLPRQASSVDTDQIVATVVAQVQSTLPQQAQVTSVIYKATPAAATVAGEAESLQQTLTRLYQQANPSVVYIIVSSTSSGSGFVYSESGYIVTNRHVVAAGDSYEIVFASGERMRAELVGADADSDLAVLKVDKLPNGVRPLSLADADIQVGQLAVAIGNPFGEQGSMSLGIVSGLGRSLRSQRQSYAGSTYSLPEVIQTDAPINPGNSGGPLLNLDGQVIGINAAIASTSGTNSGVGFAIPVAAVKQIVPSLIEKGTYTYPYMGATFDDEISLDEQAVYGVSQTRGAYVVGVTAGSPADKAGLIAANPQTGKGGDLIVDIDGQSIASFSDLNSYLVFHTRVGQTIQITVLRGSDRAVLSLTLGARP